MQAGAPCTAAGDGTALSEDAVAPRGLDDLGCVFTDLVSRTRADAGLRPGRRGGVGAVRRAARARTWSRGSVVDLETALFEADHGSPAQALTAAQAAYDRAPSVFAADALAWALHKNGRHEQALAKADEALALGVRPASFLFHRGMIAQALGRDADAARDLRDALEVNPHFSVPHATTARAALTALGA